MRPLVLGKVLAAVGAALAGLFLASKAGQGSVLSKAPAPAGDPYAPQDTVRPGECDPVAKPGVKAFRAFVIGRYGERPGSPENIVRACSAGSPSEHWVGRAWDWMVPSSAAGNALVRDLTANGDALLRAAGIMYFIWDRRIWRSYGAGRGTFGAYTGTSPHTDHVHFSFGKAGAAGETSFYKGIA